MHHHYIVDVVIRAFHPVVQPAKFAAGVFIGNGVYPGHLELLSCGFRNDFFSK
jgi:hypothetical protein